MTDLNGRHGGTYDSQDWVRCINRTPSTRYKYYLLFGYADGQVSYYSKGIAWSAEGEVRVARLVRAADAAQYYRSKGVPLVVVETIEEFQLWMLRWGCIALVEKNIWEAQN